MGQPDSNHGRGAGKSWPPAEAEFPSLICIPEHQLLCCIGRGSYGQVWLARNAMGALRAVKIVFRDSFDNERPFLRELSGIRRFEPISRLHEGFLDVLQVGTNEEGGYFYYIMELGDDQVTGAKIDPAAYSARTLATEIARRGRLSLPECLQLGLALSRALAELHQHELVHRDIKPGNIIFVDGVPKLADIGLVTHVDDTRSYVGTAGFIAPEGPGKPQADIYSLGMVLYEASTGKDRNEYPLTPTEWDNSPEYPGLMELNEIILQACKEIPTERYRTAWDMHADLVVVLNGKSVKRLKQLERRMAQLKHIAGVAVLFAIIAVLAIYAVFREWRLANQEHQRQISANITYGNQAMESGDLFAALPYFTEALRLDQAKGNAERNDRLRLGSVLAQCPKLIQMKFEPMQVNDAQFSPDNQRILVSQYFYGKALVYDLASGWLVQGPFGQPTLRSAVYSPDGRYILTTAESDRRPAIVWDTATLTEVVSLPHTNGVYTGRFSPDGRRIVTPCTDGIARVWDTRTGELELSLARQSDSVVFAEFSHNGKLIVTASHNGQARLWHAEDGSLASEPLAHPTWVNYAAFSPDDAKLVTACDDHRARVWEVATGRRIMPDLVHRDVVETAEFSPDGRMILTTSFDGTARLWRTSDLQPRGSNPVLRHGTRVTHATFSSDGRLILTTGYDGSIRVWDLAGASVPSRRERRLYCQDASRFLIETNQRLAVFAATNGLPVADLFGPDSAPELETISAHGEFVLTATIRQTPELTNHVVEVWNVQTGKAVGPAVTVSPPFTGAVVSERGERIAVYGRDHARTYDARTGAALSSELVEKGPINFALFDPSGELLVTVAGVDVQVREATSGRPMYPPMKHAIAVVHASFSSDGRLLVTCSSDITLAKCEARIWDMRTGRQVGAPLRHGDGVLSAAFSPDGRRVATASEDFTARIWDNRTGKQIGLPLRHAGQVEGVAWAPDGEWVATASIDCTARLWDPQTGDPLTPALSHPKNLWSVKFLPDAHHLVVGSGGGYTCTWNLSVDSRPLADIEATAELLSGGDFMSPVTSSKPSAEPLPRLWGRLRAAYPETFSVRPEAIARWHEHEVEASEAEQDWRAAVFHLKCLLKFRPTDEWVREHLATANKHLGGGQ